jgi:4-hydroxybenzoate polyprenyltransferase
MSPAILISFLYIFRLKGKNLRDIPNLKIHLIAFSWVFVLILFPFLVRFYVTEDFIRPFIALILGHYFYVVAVTIPFDIRDLKYDKEKQKTIPQRAGVNGAKMIAIGLLLVSAIFLTGLTPIRVDNYWFYAAILVQIILVLAMNTKRSDIYCAGWVDGAIALLGLAYFMN